MKSGIYKITNLKNNKVYIGQAINLTRRKGDYFNGKKKPPHGLIGKAFLKYGAESFSFEILERCPKENLNDREGYYIDLFDSCNKTKGYNMLSGGDANYYNTVHTEEWRKKRSEQYTGEKNPFFGKKHSEESRKKIGEIQKNIKGEDRHNFGKPLSEEAKRKMRESKKGKTLGENNPFYGKRHSDESKEKISKSKKGRQNLKKRKAILQLDLNSGEIIKEWDSTTSAALHFGKIGNICNVLRGRGKNAFGFGWRFK